MNFRLIGHAQDAKSMHHDRTLDTLTRKEPAAFMEAKVGKPKNDLDTVLEIHVDPPLDILRSNIE